jgi:hypothetical protein
MDDTYLGAPKPGKRGRGAAGKAKVVVAVETPAEKKKPRFAAMRMVPSVSSEESQLQPPKGGGLKRGTPKGGSRG